MDKFIMLFKFFLGCFRTFDLSRSIYRIYNHFSFFNRSRKIVICVCDGSFHNHNSILNSNQNSLNTAFIVSYMYLYYKFSNTIVKQKVKQKYKELMF